MICPSSCVWVVIARLRDIAAAVHNSPTGGGNFTGDYLRGSSTFEPVTAVPEPGSLLLAACGAVLAAFASWGRRRSLFLASAIAVVLLGTAGPVGGATLYWDTNGTTAGYGGAGNGTWGVDQFWTTTGISTTDGSFADGGRITTTADDTLVINKGDHRTGGVVMDVKGDRSALRILNPNGASGALVTINKHVDGGSIWLYGVGSANPITDVGGESRITINAPVVLKQNANSDVYIGSGGGGREGRQIFQGGLSSDEFVNLIFNKSSDFTISGDLSGFKGTLTNVSVHNNLDRGVTISSVIGSGVTDVTQNGTNGIVSSLMQYHIMPLTAAGNAYTGDTIINDSLFRTATNTSLPETTNVRIFGDAIFNLNFTGINDVAGLYFLGVEQSLGTWGAIGNASTDFQSSFFTGTGALRVVAVPEPSSLALLGFGSLLMMARRAIVRRWVQRS